MQYYHTSKLSSCAAEIQLTKRTGSVDQSLQKCTAAIAASANFVQDHRCACKNASHNHFIIVTIVYYCYHDCH